MWLAPSGMAPLGLRPASVRGRIWRCRQLVVGVPPDNPWCVIIPTGCGRGHSTQRVQAQQLVPQEWQGFSPLAVENIPESLELCSLSVPSRLDHLHRTLVDPQLTSIRLRNRSSILPKALSGGIRASVNARTIGRATFISRRYIG
jgi:hypothetical protein